MYMFGGYKPEAMHGSPAVKPQPSKCSNPDCKRKHEALEQIINLPLGQRSAHYVYEGIARDALEPKAKK